MMVITSDAGIYFILGPVCCICDELGGKCSHLNRRPCNPFAPSLACPPPQTASIDPRFEIEIGSHYCRAYIVYFCDNFPAVYYLYTLTKFLKDKL